MSKKKLHHAKKVISRIKEARQFKTDTQLADYFDVAPSTIATWKRRDTVDFRLIVSKCKDLDLNWIFLGQRKNPSGEAPESERIEEVVAENERLQDKITSLQGEVRGLERALKVLGGPEAVRRVGREEGFTATETTD